MLSAIYKAHRSNYEWSAAAWPAEDPCEGVRAVNQAACLFESTGRALDGGLQSLLNKDKCAESLMWGFDAIRLEWRWGDPGGNQQG